MAKAVSERHRAIDENVQISFSDTFEQSVCDYLRNLEKACIPWLPGVSLDAHSRRKITHWSLCNPCMAFVTRYMLKAMKRSDSTTLRRHVGLMKARNIENELKKIREELAWMQTEQKEIECWIHLALRDVGRLPHS